MIPPEHRIRKDAALLAIMVGAAGASSVFAATAILAHGLALGTLALLGALFSIAAFPMTVLVFWAARRLFHRELRTRLLMLRRDDVRNKDNVAATISLCHSLALGLRRPGSARSEVASTMRHIADRIGTSAAMYGYLFTDAGRRIADRALDSLLEAISALSCAPVDLSGVIRDLGLLGGELLDIDGDELVARRMREAGAAGP